MKKIEDETLFWAFPPPGYGDAELKDTIKYHKSRYSFRDYHGRTSTTLYANNVTGPDDIRRLIERVKVMQIRNDCSLLMQINYRYVVKKTYTKIGVSVKEETRFFYEVSNSTYIDQDYFFHDEYINSQGQKFIFKRPKKMLKPSDCDDAIAEATNVEKIKERYDRQNTKIEVIGVYMARLEL